MRIKTIIANNICFFSGESFNINFIDIILNTIPRNHNNVATINQDVCIIYSHIIYALRHKIVALSLLI